MAGNPRLSPALNVVVAAVEKAGRRLLRDFGEVEQLQVSAKAPGDFVSAADLRAEETLRQELGRARPQFGFLMEESGESGNADWEWRWVVDPLDGTSNFLHGIPHWAISVGVEKRAADGKSEVVAGVVYNPASNELFWAEKGMGAFLNDKRLRVSGRREMKEALFATGIPFAPVKQKAEFSHTLARLMPQVAGIRRFGAAALDLAWLAAGRYDGFWELGLKPWDVAAGMVSFMRRDDLRDGDKVKSQALPRHKFIAGAPALLAQIQQALYDEAKARLDANIVRDVTSFEGLAEYFGAAAEDDEDTLAFKGWVRVPWSRPTGEALEEVDKRLKAQKLTIRNAPMDQPSTFGACIFTGAPGVEEVLIGRSY